MRDALMDPLTLLVDLLAVYRLTRLIVKDSLLNEVRWWILRRWPSAMTTFPDNLVVSRATTDGMTTGHLESGQDVFLSADPDDDGEPVWLPFKTYKLTELIECPWCAGPYVAAIVLACREWMPGWNYVAVILAFSALVGLIFTHLDN